MHYDVFKKLPDGSKIWMFEVAGVHEARARLEALRNSDSVQYYVCDLRAKRVVAMTGAGSGELRPILDDPGFFGASAAVTPPGGHAAAGGAESGGLSKFQGQRSEL